MTLTGNPRPISERDFTDPVAGRQRANQDFLEDIEVGRLQLEFPQDRTAVEAIATREIVDRQREAAAKGDVQDPAHHAPGDRHLRGATLDIAGGDHDIALAASGPQVFEERGIVRPIRVERDDVLAARLLEAGPVRAAESGELLAPHADAVLAYDLLRVVPRAAIDHDDLERRPQRHKCLFQLGQYSVEVFPFVQGRKNQAEGATRYSRRG